jgi:hypothetical protein
MYYPSGGQVLLIIGPLGAFALCGGPVMLYVYYHAKEVPCAVWPP